MDINVLCGVCWPVANFPFPLPVGSGLAEKQTIQNGVLAFHSQEASYHCDSLEAKFLFSPFSSLHSLYSGVTNNRGGTTRWAAGKLWEGRRAPVQAVTKQLRRHYEERKQWFPFLLWVCLKQQPQKPASPHLAFLAAAHPDRSSFPSNSDKCQDLWRQLSGHTQHLRKRQDQKRVQHTFCLIPCIALLRSSLLLPSPYNCSVQTELASETTRSRGLTALETRGRQMRKLILRLNHRKQFASSWPELKLLQ